MRIVRHEVGAAQSLVFGPGQTPPARSSRRIIAPGNYTGNLSAKIASGCRCILFLSTRCSATFTLQRQNGFSSTRTETERYLQRRQRRHQTTNATRRIILHIAGVFKPSNSFCATSHGLQAQRLSKVLSSREFVVVERQRN